MPGGMGAGLPMLISMLLKGAQLPFLGQDYEKAQAAADEANKMHRGAITGAQAASEKYGAQGRNIGESGVRMRGALIGNAATSQQQNVDDWLEGYFKRGYSERTSEGLGGTAKGLADDYWAKLMGGLDDSGLTGAVGQAEANLAQIPAYQKEFGQARAAGYENIAGIDKDRALVKSEYETSKAELRTRADAHSANFMQQRAGYEIASVMQPLLAQKSQALQELENARWSGNMTDDEFLARKASIETQATQAAATAAGAKQSELNQLVITSTTALETGFQTATANMFGNLGAALTGFAGAKASTINSIVNSLDVETDFINSAVANATMAGKAYMDVVTEGAGKYMDTIWDGLNKDASARKFAEVDAPNYILEQELNANLASEYSYTQDMFRAMDKAAAFEAAGLDMQFAFTPLYASFSPFIQTAIGNFENQFGMASQYGAAGDAHAAQNRNYELGVAGVATEFATGMAPMASPRFWQNPGSPG